PVADTGGHLDGDLAAGTHAAVAAALAAGIRDRLADTAAGGARPGRHDLAEERTLDGLDLTGTAARLAAHGLRVSVGTGTGARVAQDRGVDSDRLGDAAGAFLEGQAGPEQRVGAGLDSAARTAGTAGAATEERLEDVAEAATESGTAEAARTAATGFERVAAEVDDASLLGIRQHLVGGRDLLETLLRRLVGVHIRVVLARQLAVRPFDLLVGRVLGHAERPVVVPCHVWFSSLRRSTEQKWTVLSVRR